MFGGVRGAVLDVTSVTCCELRTAEDSSGEDHNDNLTT